MVRISEHAILERMITMESEGIWQTKNKIIYMIFIYQVKSIEHTRKYFEDLVSPQGKPGVTIIVCQYYISWFGPIMPSRKFGIVVSDDGTEIKKWTPEIWAKYKELRAGTKTPIRLWKGTFIILTLFALVFIMGRVNTSIRQADEKKVAEYFAHPQAGDILYASTGGTLIIDKNAARGTDQLYALFKIQKIVGDSIFLLKGNTQEINSPQHPVNEYTSGFWENLQDKTSSYENTPFVISHQAILYDKQFIIIPREENAEPGKVYNIIRSGK